MEGYTKFQQLIMDLMCNGPASDFFERAQAGIQKFLESKVDDAIIDYEQRGYTREEISDIAVTLEEFIKRVFEIPKVIK